MKKKVKKNSWHQLQDEKCPKCGGNLMRDLFEKGKVGCVCSFNLKEDVKKTLVARDKQV